MKKMFFFAILALGGVAATVETGYKPGDVVSDFKLKNVDGKEVSLMGYTASKKGAIVIFTCNHCPYAQAYEQRIIDLDKKYSAKGYPVIAINPNDPVIQPDDSYESMQKRAKEKGYTFPYLIDESQKVTREFGAARTPHVFLLNRDVTGAFKVAYIGAIDDNSDDASAVQTRYAENAIASLERNEKPSPEVTKAIGCTIKWTKTTEGQK